MAKACIGLDLGSTAVKMAQVRPLRGGTRELTAFGIEPVPTHTIVDGTIMNQGAMVDAVRALRERLGIKQRDVALAVSGHSVIIKKIAAPPLSQEELEAHVMTEAERHIPFAIDEVEIDHQLLGSKTADGLSEVLLVAAKKEVVRDYAAVAREAQLNPVVVDVASFALQNAYEAAYDAPAPGEAVVLVCVGASTSHINILSSGTTAFTRDVTMIASTGGRGGPSPGGGELFTQELMRQLGVSHEDAEAFKRAASEDLPLDVQRILQSAADQLAGEYAKSLDFFLSTHPGVRFSNIFIAGGSALLAFLHQAIETRAGIPVAVMDPLRRLQVPRETTRCDGELVRHNPAQGAIAIGLALRHPGDRFA